MNNHQKSKRRVALLLIALLVAAAGFVSWWKFYRDVPQPSWMTASARDRFLYASTGAERSAGIPYWIWLVLPRIFPEYLPYPGGYAALGMTWEEGREMPAGFSKKTVGYVRVAANCALCHAASYRSDPAAVPEVVAAIPGHTVDVQPLLTFLKQCAQDPRFNASELLAEIDMATDLTFVDRLIYRFILIPRTQQALLDQRPVILDPTLRAHGENPDAPFSDPALEALKGWVKDLRAPAYPLPVDAALASAGKPLFAQHCASCHAVDPAAKTKNKVSPLSEVGTDRTLLDQWAAASNEAGNGTAAGSSRREMIKDGGYIAPPLSGIWLRGPYLHNGSVASLRDLLEPQARRRSTFFPDNDVVDAENVGFISTMEEEPGRRKFRRFDTTKPGNGNAGHLYATELSRPDKDALLEYLKTL
jgi:mono/diheme cytochrome c family protein